MYLLRHNDLVQHFRDKGHFYACRGCAYPIAKIQHTKLIDINDGIIAVKKKFTVLIILINKKNTIQFKHEI